MVLREEVLQLLKRGEVGVELVHMVLREHRDAGVRVTLDLPLRRLILAQQHIQQRGLANTVRAKNCSTAASQHGKTVVTE
mgnify:CR=1 FL=1